MVPTGTFYRIASTIIGTTTFDDQNASGTYPTVGTLSDAIGAYGLQPSARYLNVDEDRLLWFGHYTDTSKMSQFGWSPVGAAPGAGNDERLPIVDTGGTAVSNVRNVDPTVGGEGTGSVRRSTAPGICSNWPEFTATAARWMKRSPIPWIGLPGRSAPCPGPW
jgi:hypothetical protein